MQMRMHMGQLLSFVRLGMAWASQAQRTLHLQAANSVPHLASLPFNSVR